MRTGGDEPPTSAVDEFLRGTANFARNHADHRKPRGKRPFPAPAVDNSPVAIPLHRGKSPVEPRPVPAAQHDRTCRDVHPGGQNRPVAEKQPRPPARPVRLRNRPTAGNREIRRGSRTEGFGRGVPHRRTGARPRSGRRGGDRAARGVRRTAADASPAPRTTRSGRRTGCTPTSAPPAARRTRGCGACSRSGRTRPTSAKPLGVRGTCWPVPRTTSSACSKPRTAPA